MLGSKFEEIVQLRRSNRSFDPEVEVPDEVIKRSLERAILSPNSSNMQLWSFFWIRSEEEKKRFQPLCLDQYAAKSAKHLVVFVTRRDLWKERAKWNADQIKRQVVGEPDKYQKRMIQYYEKLLPIAYGYDFLGIYSFLRKSISFFMSITKPFVRMGGSANQRIIVQKSCALAAQTFMLSIAAEGYHTCPMEGFDEVRVRKALNLHRIAEINMVVAVGKGTEKGIWGERNRVPFNEVVFVK
jgi:nitroreductase